MDRIANVIRTVLVTPPEFVTELRVADINKDIVRDAVEGRIGLYRNIFGHYWRAELVNGRCVWVPLELMERDPETLPLTKEF